MSRSTKDSDDDYEPKTDRVRALAAQTAVNSPSLRRSSRIKQNRSSSVSPVSDTSSINSNQLTRVIRKQTATMDSISSDVPKDQRSRRISISSDISETMDIGTPSKRITRRSIAALSSVTTPTKMNTRASNRRFVRAGSETKSPSPAVRVTRRTRASSADPESLPDESKSQPNTPIKVRKRASVLPANSPVKEEVEEHLIPYVRLDLTIFEEEPTNSANSNCSPEKLSRSQQSQKVNEKRKSADKNKAEKENDEVTSSPVTLDETPEQLENNIPDNSNSNSSILKTSNSSIGNLNCSLDELKCVLENENANETRKNVNEVKENNDKATSSSIVSQSDEAVELPEKNKIFNKSNDNMDTITMDNKKNLEDSNYLSDKVSQSQASQKISKRHKSGNKDNIEKNDNLGHEAKLDRSENKSEMHNNSMDKSMHDKESLDEKQYNATESPSSDDNTISSKVPMDILDTTENDNNDMKLMLEGQSPCHNADEVSSHVINLDSSAKSLVDMEISSPINKKSNDQPIVKNKQSVKKNYAPDNLDLSKQESQKDVSKHIKESESPRATEPAPKPTSSGSDIIITVQDNEPSSSADTSEEQILLAKLPKKEFIQQDTKQSNVDEASDDLEINNSQLKKTEEDQETFPRINIVDSDSESCINHLFSNVPANDQEKETTKEDDNADENSQEYCSSQSMKKDQDNESEAECDLVLVDKQAWLAAENMKVTRKEVSSEYDSDDTVVKKSKLDAARANSSKVLSIIDEEASTDVEKMDVSPTKKSHKNEKRSRKDKNSSIGKQYVEDTDSSSLKSLSDSIVSSLDRNKDYSSSKLNNSEQAARTAGRLSEIHSESDKEAKDDADRLNKSSRTNKSLRRKSSQLRKSLNESSKDTSLKQNDRNARNSFMDGDRTDKQEESDSLKISRKERCSLNKSCNKDNDTTEKKKSEKKKKSLSNKDDSEIAEEACLNRSTGKNLETLIKPLISLIDDDSSDNDININIEVDSDNDSDSDSDSDSDIDILPAMDIEFNNYSPMSYVGSNDDGSDDNDKITNTSESSLSFSFAKSNYSTMARAGSSYANDSNILINDMSESSSDLMPLSDLIAKSNSDNDNDTEDNSMNSDIRKEYNLDGAEQKFDDDNVPHDECRASESEYSDPNDNGSDLADFIVNDNEEVETEKEEEKDNDEEQEKNDEEDEQEEMDEEDEQEEMDDEDKQNKEEDNEIRKEKEKVNTKNKKRKTEKDYREEEIEEYVMNENEDADDEQSEVEIDSNDGSNESNDEDESTKIIDGNEKSIEIIPSRISGTKKKQITEETIMLDMSNSSMCNKSKKTHIAKTNETILISPDSPLYVKAKRKSLLRSSEKIETEQESPKQLEESTTKSRFSRKLSKLHASMECSTPKLNSTKYNREFNIETPEALKKIQESKDSESETTQNTLPKKRRKEEKMKSKDSTMKRNTSLTDVLQSDKCSVEKPINTSLPSDLVKAVGKANLSKSTISKTMNLTHTETPTLRHLRKEKLNESAPVTKLHLEVDESKEKSSTTVEKDNVVTTEVKEKNDEEIPNLEQSNNNTRKRKRQKKRKRQAEEMNKDITDKTLSEDTTLESVLQDKKRIKLSESLTIENDICKDTPHINEKKKKKKEKIGVSEQYENVKKVDTHQNNRNDTKLVKHKKNKKAKNLSNSESNASTNDTCKDTPHINEKKKKMKEQIGVNEECENVKEADMHQNDRNKTKLVKHKKNKKVKIASNSESNAPMNDHTTVNTKFEQQKQQMAQSEEILPEKPTKKKKKQKKEKDALLSTKVSETKSKNLESDTSQPYYWPQIAHPATIKSINAKSEEEKRKIWALPSRDVEMRLRAGNHSKGEAIEQIRIAPQLFRERDEKEAKNRSRKRKEVAAERRSAFASSSEDTVARLSDDVINNLEDIPTSTIKRRRLWQSEKSTTPPQPKTSRSKGSKSSKNASMKLSAFGATTEFTITNLKKIQKQPPKQSAAAVSFRQRMLDRNKREPVSAYLMYLEKQRASRNNRSSNAS